MEVIDINYFNDFVFNKNYIRFLESNIKFVNKYINVIVIYVIYYY